MRDRLIRYARRLTGRALVDATPTSLLLLRLENLDLLRDRLGKAGLGHLIVTLAMRLGRSVRPADPVRIVGSGLLAVSLHEPGEAEAMRIATRVHRRAQAPIAVGGMTVTPVLTGVVLHGGVGVGLNAMIDDAAARLDQASTHGLGQVRLYGHRTKPRAAPLAPTLAEAARSGQIVAFFQPQTCCHTGHLTGFEALARWQHPAHGLLSPNAFMPKMTGNDHNALTLSMLRQSLAAIRHWDAKGWHVPTVSLNISHCELADTRFAESVLWELDRHEVPADRLVLEVLETVGPLAADSDARRNLDTLSHAGCALDLDDFGTGYAGLDAIRQFGVNRIKIDRSFVTDCASDPVQQRMILAILALAERLDLRTLAEGVETPEEHAFLAQMGCDEVQGFVVARPMPLHDADDFLTRHASHTESLPLIARRKAG